MNRWVILFFMALISLFFVSCKTNKEPIQNTENLLIGSWVNAEFNEDTRITVFTRAESLISNEYGMTFKEDNVFIARTSGSCGTPPLTYDDEEGNWLEENGIITFTTNYFPYNYEWEIVSVTEEKLIIKRL